MHQNPEDLLDSLSLDFSEDDEETTTLVIPRKCYNCKMSKICSVLPTFLSISKLGIYVGIEKCGFFGEKDAKKSK